MKTLQFTVPVTPDRTVIIQEDIIPQFYPHLHRHKEAQLIWIIRGEGTLIAENTMHSFKANDIFMIAPNQSHVFKGSRQLNDDKSAEGVHSISVFYDPNGHLANFLQLPELSQLNAFLKEYKYGFKLPEQHFHVVSKHILKLKASNNMDQMLNFLHLLRTFCKMNPKPKHLSTFSKEHITDGEGLRMGNIYNYILHHYQNALTLEEVAAEAHLTPQAFCRYFKKHTGVTFVTFLNEMRINQACKKLTAGEYDSIATVAYNCGFNSITNFNRVFKSVAGASPKEYLSKYLNNVQ
ncbi:helix-turn-helix domain-containing protein [Parapedobacter sp. ISTM3]|uniref:AraC-type DNA-binding protein n=1 Tax=Parapedobacter luteus TaxID=623280 RepID=A0A1T4ZTY6_9SPHI|nr:MULTISPECIES: AraC family transcriptional regulator [Parapedobacter]MBK1438637.1 helix-turn-helix domain-containing protein [Parapedobacter sp. ISTM3]SKB26200.1 AraC-type DNA-binding protein [Parapedobacter luteus]